MKKITVDKEEGVAEVIERALGAEDDEVAIVVPTGSALGRSIANFHLLKREADAAGKTIVVESVDENILAFARESDLDASHPLWRGVRGAGGVSDIIPAGGEGAELAAMASVRPAAKRRGAAKAGKKKTEPTKLVVRDESDEEEWRGEGEGGETGEASGAEAGETSEANATFDDEGSAAFEEKESRFFRRRSAPELSEDESDEGKESRPRRSGRLRAVWWAVGIVAVVLVSLGILTWSFGRAAIAITFQKTPWSYEGNFIADRSAGAADAANGVIPAQAFSAQKNATELFPASGSANVSVKAQGTITIYDNYSAAPQELVATTRFLTPDGKLFRLVNNVTVPGAKVANGAITPSSLQATVVADQPGPAYNVGPVPKLSIPGFKGTPRYDGFYGALPNGASGGASGVRPVPTAADIVAAKAKMQSILQAALTGDIAASYPNHFKILDGATEVTVTKLTVNTTTDANGNFSVFGEAALRAIGFDESALKGAILAIAQQTEASSTWASLTLTYSGVKPDFTKGTINFAVAAQGDLEPSFSADDFKASIAGKSVNAARAAVAAIPGLANGKISVWPMWLWSIPANPANIAVTVQ